MAGTSVDKPQHDSCEERRLQHDWPILFGDQRGKSSKVLRFCPGNHHEATRDDRAEIRESDSPALHYFLEEDFAGVAFAGVAFVEVAAVETTGAAVPKSLVKNPALLLATTVEVTAVPVAPMTLAAA